MLEDQAREDKTSRAALEEKLVCSQNDAKRLQQEHGNLLFFLLFFYFLILDSLDQNF